MDSGRNYGGGRGRGGGGGGGRGYHRDQGGRGRGNGQNQPIQGGGKGWAATPRGSYNQPPSQQQCASRPPEQAAPPQAWGPRPPMNSVPQQPRPQAWGPRPSPAQQPSQMDAGPSIGRSGQWTGRPWAPSARTTSAPPVQSPPLHTPPQPLADKPVSPPSGSKKTETQPIPRPDRGGTLAIRKVPLLVNHFHVGFDKQSTIFHYDVDVKFLPENGGAPLKKALRKSDSRFIKDLLYPGAEKSKTAFDGEKNIFSAMKLPVGQFRVEVSEGEDTRRGSYMVTIKLVNELNLSKLHDYLKGNVLDIPRDALQGMDLVMKENPLRNRMIVGRGFYSARGGEELGGGLAAYKGFSQSLKPTSQGLSLCLDYSILSFRKPMAVLDFLKEHIRGFSGANDVKRFRKDVERALKGLKVRVTHRKTKQKFTIAGLTAKDTREISFDFIDPEGVKPTENIRLIQYFKDKWGKDVEYPNIPCLDLGKVGKKQDVPMEFCELVEGQRYPKEDLDKDTALFLKKLTLAKPWDRRRSIDEMVRADDGPYGNIASNFGITLDVNMTRVTGRVIGAPDVKVGAARSVKVDAEKCQWNLVGKSFVEAKSLDSWAMIDFTDGDRRDRLDAGAFINRLRDRCRQLGIRMSEPLYRLARMVEFSSVNRLESLLKSVVEESNGRNKGKLQMIVCVMTRRDPGYKFLKWVSETKIGVVTQCCLSLPANKGQDQYLANLCLKINAKLGGNNFEVTGRLLQFDAGDHVMFIGADVNHPAPMNKSCPSIAKSCPSIAAVVGSVNWPAANRYAARIRPQEHRCERINNFGAMCLDLVKTYGELNNGIRPKRIVVFRDGVSEGQFEMVLAEELIDLKKSIYNGDYQPPITVIVAQKRHQTRLFVENKNDGGQSGNVPPGTVVDNTIVHPHDFDFYLCSHYGGLGTSKPTHYYVLWDENSFTSDQLQKLIYDMCFTFVRCTKPVSLVPPVYYADLVAYRGRMFQEVVMDAAASAAASFEQSFYSMHSELENEMFFV